ncbi:plasmid replication protein RepC [Methylobrevis pamukkalensis]|uniref:Uncharacterized protein n=1 Tax=Methylobrevis pamukkalensis TaxID=1439726 RepID=A0A1E3GXI6_9HYPH|nr:plasmid replication protein RepC [Methylobrevis pamukkalensis]ODN68635.1 hypothetical protein A6302_04071 [Methylobrevis pamukkalensis]
MLEHVTTPFGARGLSRAMLAGQATAAACPPDARAEKWRLLRDATEARARLGVSDRALAVLSALLSFHQGDELCAEDGLVVFPSNRTLSQRAHGISEATLRRAIAQLVAAGLIVRQDSPNGKRYARRDGEGNFALAFGFDLRPLLARAGEIMAHAETVRDERRQLAELREEVTLLRRDISKTIAWAIEESVEGWEAVAEAYAALSGSTDRRLSIAGTARLRDGLAELKADAAKLLESIHLSTNSNGNDHHHERHKQDSNQTPISDSESFENEARGNAEHESAGSAGGADGSRKVPGEEIRLHLGMILKACPDIGAYTPGGVSDWGDLVTAAERARAALGISPDAWRSAVSAMGESGAAVTVATILQRAEEINSPGGYLRALTAKAASGGFTPAPVVMSLWRQQARASSPPT